MSETPKIVRSVASQDFNVMFKLEKDRITVFADGKVIQAKFNVPVLSAPSEGVISVPTTPLRLATTIFKKGFAISIKGKTLVLSDEKRRLEILGIARADAEALEEKLKAIEEYDAATEVVAPLFDLKQYLTEITKFIKGDQNTVVTITVEKGKVIIEAQHDTRRYRAVVEAETQGRGIVKIPFSLIKKIIKLIASAKTIYIKFGSTTPLIIDVGYGIIASMVQERTVFKEPVKTREAQAQAIQAEQ